MLAAFFRDSSKIPEEKLQGGPTAAHGLRAVQDGWECGPTQNRKFT